MDRAEYVSALKAELAAVRQTGRAQRVAAIEAELARFDARPAIVETAGGVVKARAPRRR